MKNIFPIIAFLLFFFWLILFSQNEGGEVVLPSQETMVDMEEIKNCLERTKNDFEEVLEISHSSIDDTYEELYYIVEAIKDYDVPSCAY